MKKQQDPNNPAPKAPPSEARRAAARADGAKSRGPRTPEGKKRSCRNALKHGLLAHNVTVSDTETEILETLEQAYTERFTPRDALEFHAVEELAYYKYQMRQTWMMQAATLHVQMVRDFQELAGEWDSIPPLERQAMAITSCLQDGPALLLLERYTRMYANLADRALNQIMKLRKERLLPDAPVDPLDEPEPKLPNEPESDASPSAPLTTDHRPLTTNRALITDHRPLTTSHPLTTKQPPEAIRSVPKGGV
jgi:hypothetical protein